MALLPAGTGSPRLIFICRNLSASSPSPSQFTASGGHAFDPAIRRLAKSRQFSEIEALLEPRKLDIPPETSSREPHLASIITAYTNAGMIDHAIRTIDELPRLGSPRTTLSLNALLSACNHSKVLFRRVPDLLSDLFRRHSLSPDEVSYGILIKSLCLAGDASKAHPVLEEMMGKKIEVTAVSYTTVMDSLYKEGKPEAAERIWKEMHAKGITPDTTAYNVRVMYRAKNGKPEQVLEIMKEIETAGLKPDTITYNYLMSSYCSFGKFDHAKRVYKELREKGCQPNASTYKNMLYALCKNEDFEGGLEVFHDSVKHRKVPDLGSVQMLVGGLMKGSRKRDAKRVVTGLRKKFPKEFVGSWKRLEKMVGLSSDEEAPLQAEVA
ncbi:Pentatricopeptide repeat-containing protein [Apostasia shenzhenica]|uniref:Pentatricopeptide repeat-containing protein n=1 Tax=Apostasia shenzhenica TaxID=1088818 RepID=A0A2I0BBL1_9ASPA|nr:Pentatricopeptide repeat-containing protein [Apostasia shenzhenica]